jgi:uncharacterized protein
MIELEYDQKKSASNLSKHGIDLDTARGLWLDPDLLEVPARTQAEPGTTSVKCRLSHMDD